MLNAGVAELVDATDLGSVGATCGGSSPSARTTYPLNIRARNSQGTLARDAKPWNTKSRTARLLHVAMAGEHLSWWPTVP